MEFSPRQMWWFNFALFTIQAGTAISWTTLGIDAKWVAMISQFNGFAAMLLQFIVHGNVPGVGMTSRTAPEAYGPGTPSRIGDATPSPPMRVPPAAVALLFATGLLLAASSGALAQEFHASQLGPAPPPEAALWVLLGCILVGAALLIAGLVYGARWLWLRFNKGDHAMKSLALLAVLSFAAVTVASAADLPSVTKAPSSLFTGYPYAGQGFYFGLNSFAAAGSAEASAPGLNPNSLITNQGAVGVTVGYVWATQNVFYAVEGMFDFTNLNGSAPGLSFNGPAAFEQRIKIGTPLNNFLGLFPTLGLPSIPPFPALPDGQVASNIHPYLMGGLHEDAIGLNFGAASNKTWQFSPSIGVGMMGQLTKGIAIDTWAEVVFANKSVCVGAFADGCVKQGTKYQIGFGVYY